MIKIRALNRDSLSDEDNVPTIRREAQEEIALDLYNKSLRHQCDGNNEEALTILKKLLTENIPQLELQGGLPKTMSTIKYCCYFNLGNIYIHEKNDSLALDNYLKAAELDSSDVTLWHKIGVIALRLDKLKQAAYAFLQGLECNESHWPCLDKLINVLYAIQDTVTCLLHIDKAINMDKNYIKGYVLRKLIFKSNPAIKEYYQAYNPNYLHENNFNTLIVSEEDEKKVMKDVEPLCKKIRDLEESLGPKPLPTIGLPSPLQNFTWLSLGETILNIHKYLTDNKMSYLSKIDINKCIKNDEINNDVEMTEKIVVESVTENVIEQNNKANNLPNPENVQVEIIENLIKEDDIERRPSVSSENNNLSEPNCSQGEDNDNDNEMDQDTEDQEDNSEQKDNDKKRNPKRKRDLLSDLQIWGWHSKRKYAKKGKSEKDLTFQDALLRIIPANLLPNGINLDEYKNIEKEKKNVNVFENLFSSFPLTQQLTDKYFGSELENSDVSIFWFKERKFCDVIDLIEEYIITLANMWDKKWPKELVLLYLEVYEKYREHFEHPQLFSGVASFDEIKNDALVTLLYGEIVYFYLKKEERDDKKIHPTSLVQLNLLSSWKNQWKEDYLTLFVRIHWLRANVLTELSNHYLAICAYQLMEEVINDEESKSNTEYVLNLPNCNTFNVITKEVILKLLNHLEIIDSLSRVESLYENEQYTEVINILKITFECGSNIPTWGRIGRPAQLVFLMHSFWFIDRSECFVWTEKCLAEATSHFLDSSEKDSKWDMVVVKCITILHEIIKQETVIIIDQLSKENRQRLIENLCKIVIFQLNLEGRSTLILGTVTPLLVLHYVLLREEHRLQSKRVTNHRKKDKNVNENDSENVSEQIPPSVAVLFSAHEFLGNKSLCLIGEGELLHFIIDKVLDRLDTPIFENLREKIDIHLEQAFFCLYQHPSKKNKVSRHLADHNVNPLKLSWERAQQLYEFFCPESLPEFESFKSISISSDLEQLLQRITALVPSQYDPNPLLPKIKEFITGNTENLPETIEFPIKTRAIYYLLGDYYFKQSEVKRSLKYFMLDLCCNPLRLDSWADLALGLANQLENRLNHCEGFKSEKEFNEEAKSAQTCFKQALKLADNHITLWIEFGSFEYSIHSHYSRILKYESDTISMEMFEKLENQKEEYLGSSGKSFKKALELHQQDPIEQDERWLHHYMMGKVSEKRRMEPSEYLQHYLTALQLLQENNACYPDKINYNSPQHLAVEVLEIHYRIHASILKYMELHEGKNIPTAVGKMFIKCLERSAFPKGNAGVIQMAKEKCESVPKVELETDVKMETVPQITQIKQEEKEFDIKKTQNENKETNSDGSVIMISDSDDDKNSTKSKKNTEDDTVKTFPEIRIKNVQELMDEVMLKTMKETQYPDGNNSDTNNAEVEFNKSFEKNKDKFQAEIQKCIKEQETEKCENTDEKGIRKSTEDNTTTCSSSSESSSSDSDSDDSSNSTSTNTSSDTPTGFLNNSEVENIVNMCIIGLEEYIVRLPQNYKALYRLTHLFFHYKPKKDMSKCRQLLLGQYQCRNNSLVSGLFADRKTNNFFNGVWRIPSGEIDRPGSLAAHMVRCVTILLQVLRNTNDHKILLDVCLQLKRKPDQDKVYVKESDRIQLADHALFLCMQILRNQVKNIENMSRNSAQKFLLDLYRAYQRVQKYITEKEGEFTHMLEDVYKKFMREKLPENVNALDLALKFCQQQKAAEKVKVQHQKPAPVIASPTVSTSVPVLPTPSTINPTLNQTMKRPGLPGRARGRPPGPSKNPGMPKAYRNKSVNKTPSSSSYNPFSPYQSPLFDTKSLNLAMQYQEILRRYSQMPQIPTSTSSSLLTSNLMQMFGQMTGGSSYNPFQQNLGGLWGSGNPLNPDLSNFNSFMQQQSKVSTSTPKTKSDSRVLGSSKKSHSGVSSGSSSTFKYPSADVPKIKTKTTSSTYISKDPLSYSPKPATSTASQPEIPVLADMAKMTSQITKDRPSISITPVVPTSTSTITTTSVISSPVKTLQEKLADKQKHASAKNVSKGFSFDSKPKSTALISHIPSFPKDSGITVSQVKLSKDAVKSKNVKDFPQVRLNLSPAKSAEKNVKDSSDDDVIIIE